MVFGGSQVLIDLEPAYRMWAGDSELHGFSHTLVGAGTIAVVATVIGKPISEYALLVFTRKRVSIAWSASAAGAFLGTYTHILFDAVMHADMSPWYPFSHVNDLLGVMSISALYWLCTALGVIGALLYFVRESRK